MCGIVAVSGVGGSTGACVEGLRRLQYRGYDSYGFAWARQGCIDRLRSLEALDDLVEILPEAPAALGHTRWATHGGVTLANCHPHLAEGDRFALAHNGIVENYQALQHEAEGVPADESDTRVIVRLLAAELSRGTDRGTAVRAVCGRLRGRNTVVVLFDDGELFGYRHGSPLVLGDGGEMVFLASDALSFAPRTRRCFLVPDKALVRIRGTGIAVSGEGNNAIALRWEDAGFEDDDFGKDGHPHFMIKEVMEQWRTIPQQATLTRDALDGLCSTVRGARTVFVTGAGGAYYAARQIAWCLRRIAGVSALDVPAYEIDSILHVAAPGDVLLAISQSGETADTLFAAEWARAAGLRLASLVNMPMSSLAGMSDFTFENRSGPEICVLSTKSATAQVTFGYLLAAAIADRFDEAKAELDQLSISLTHYLVPETLATVEDVAARIASAGHLFVLGRSAHFGSALVGALNIKEASYIHAEAFSAGELKHGVIALIEPGVPVLVFRAAGDDYMLNVASEVRARGAFVIGLSGEANPLFDARLPMPPTVGDADIISSIIPCQLLAYALGVRRGVNPDKPRNLAKSVTVQ